jgi:hypothetical protein
MPFAARFADYTRRPGISSILHAKPGLLLISRACQIGASHLFAVPYERLAVYQGWIVPGLAIQGPNAAQFVMAFRRRLDQHELAGFTHDEQKVIGQK